MSMTIRKWTLEDHQTLVSQGKHLRTKISIIATDPNERGSQASGLAADCRLFLDTLERYLNSDVIATDAIYRDISRCSEGGEDREATEEGENSW